MRRFYLLTALVWALASGLPGQCSTNIGGTNTSLIANKGGTNISLIDSNEVQKVIEELEAESEPQSEAETRIQLAQTLKADYKFEVAEKILVGVLRKDPKPQEQQRAMVLLADILTESHQYGKALQVYAEYVRHFANDPTVPEVILKQALLYREMGLNVMALSRFYSVISTCLNLRSENIKEYQKLVSRAQMEIARTFFFQENYLEAAQFYERIIRGGGKEVNLHEVLYHLVKCYSSLQKWDKSIANARLFLEKNPDHENEPEVRYCLAEALKSLGQKDEALLQVMALLQAQQKNSRSNPERWEYWQRRTGRDIVRQLMQEGDYTNALEVCLQLVQLDSSLDWQLPLFYQVGLIYEALRQPAAAVEMFDKILAAEKTGANPSAPQEGSSSLFNMAKWRKEHVLWEVQARKDNDRFVSVLPSSKEIEKVKPNGTN